MTSCGSGDGSSGGSSDSSGGSAALSTTSQTLSSNGSGNAQFNFTVQSDTTAVQLVASTSATSITLTSLTGPGGANMLASNVTEVSSALSVQPGGNSFSFPTLQNSIQAGTYTANYLVQSRIVAGSGQGGASVNLSVVQKNGSTSSGGTLPVNVVFVGPTSGDQDTFDSIQGCVQVWQATFAQANITLDVQYYNFDGPNTLPSPATGDPLYAQISAATRPNAINMVIGVDVANLSGPENEDFGTAGGIPGSILPGEHSAAAFSILRVAGTDGRFNYSGSGSDQKWQDEIEVGGQVMAFLAGEYLGMQPAVSFQGDKVIATDRIPDTATCVTEIECENNSEPRDNFMFPRVYFQPGEGLETYSRSDMTPDQAAFIDESPFVN